MIAGAVLGAGCAGRAAGGQVTTLVDGRLAVSVDTTDVAARRALAALEFDAGNRGAALAQLLAVERLGGPLGSRLDDREVGRLGALLAERAAFRLAHGDAGALADLDAALAHGVTVAAATRRAAEVLDAVRLLRHAADDLRADGRRRLIAMGATPEQRGAALTASVDDRLAFARWAWRQGARRAAAETMVDGTLDDAPLRADIDAWWSGKRAAGPASAPLLVAALNDVLDGAAPGWTTAITARGALDGDLDALPVYARPTALRLHGDLAASRDALFAAMRQPAGGGDAGLVLAVEAALAGLPSRDVDALLAPVQGDLATRLRQVIVPGARAATPLDDDALVAAIVAARLGVAEFHAPLADVARAFRRQATQAAALGDAFVARTIDQAAAHAALGALYEDLGDPASARAHWQLALDTAPRDAYAFGLARAQALGGDPDAALVHVTAAAAASGDPAVVLVIVARALLDGDAPGEALEILRTALELAGADDLPAAVEAAAQASDALGRPAQALALRAEYATAPTSPPSAVDDPTDAAAALASADVARLAVAARWHPRDTAGLAARAALLERTPVDDPRHRVALVEVQALAVDATAPLLADAARAVLRARR